MLRPAGPKLVIQLLSMLEPRLTARVARSSALLDLVVILDLEDGLWDVTDAPRTAELKAKGRRDLLQLATDDAGLFGEQRLGVRVNRLSSPDGALDIEVLASASRTVTFDTIVLTKIETDADVPEWIRRLDEAGVRYGRVVPIVETRLGIANLGSIAEGASRAAVDWVVYGHYDYLLDASWWPVPEQDDEEFWVHVAPLIGQIEAAGLGYMNPPFFALDDFDRFGRIIGRLGATCRRDFGVMTFGRRQSAYATGEAPARPWQSDPSTRRPGSEDPSERAHRIIDAFLANRKPTASWVVDPARSEFISPHLYLAAVAFLARAVDG